MYKGRALCCVAEFATIFAIMVHCQRRADSGTIHTKLEYCKSRHTTARGVAQVK